MELDITEFFNTETPKDYSASVAEIGNNAGQATWQAACECEIQLLTTDEQRDAFRTFIQGFGAWSHAEIAAFTDTELSALCIQFIAGDIREAPAWDDKAHKMDWDQYHRDSENGIVAGRLFECDGKIYYSLD